MRAVSHAAAVVRRPVPAGTAAVVTALAGAGAALVGGAFLVVVVLVVQLGAAAGVLLLTDAPSFRDSMVIAGVAAVAADALAMWDDGARVGSIAGVFGLAVVASFAVELARRDRQRVTESLAATVTAVGFAVLTAHLLVLHAPQHGDNVVAVTLGCVALSLVVGRVVDAVAPGGPVCPGASRGAAGVVVSVALGAVAGAGFGIAVAPLAPRSGALLGLAVAAAAAAADVATDVASADVIARRGLSGPLAATLPVVLAAPVAYGVTRLLFG